jgi:predicted amidohydrolase
LKGAETVVVVAASPARGFQQRKPDNLQSYHRILQCTAEEHGVWGLLSMLVGFEGGKGFTGGSLVVDPFGEIVGEGPVGEEHILYARIEPEAVTVARQQAPLLADLAGVLEDILQELQSSGDELCPPR